jgi:hypothetical protein
VAKLPPAVPTFTIVGFGPVALRVSGPFPVLATVTTPVLTEAPLAPPVIRRGLGAVKDTAACAPVPARGTVPRTVPPLVTVKVAERAPRPDGVNVILMVQGKVFSGSRLAGQVFV